MLDHCEFFGSLLLEAKTWFQNEEKNEQDKGWVDGVCITYQ